MENKSQKLKNFIDKDKVTNKEIEDDSVKSLQESDGLFERIDKKLVNKKGQTLLREQLHETN